MAESSQVDMIRNPSPLEEGEVYVSAGGTYYTKPLIDAEKLKDILKNNYIAEQIERLRSLIFTDKYTISVVDAEDNEFPDIARDLMAMFEAPGVKLWSKMQQAWVDIWSWGPALFNPVWFREGNVIILKKLRRLPPESFSEASGVKGNISSEILEGICINNLQQIEYWQTDVDGKKKQIHNLVMLTDPVSSELGGTSKEIPMVPVISMIDFAWQAQMQKVNRVGSPIMFIRITKPVVNANRDDVKFAQSILQNWGKNTAYTLRENMEIVPLNPTVSQSAIETLDKLEKRILDYHSPATLIKKDGNTIGATGASEVDLVHEWIQAQHRWIEDEFQPFAQKYLEANMFTDKRAIIDIPNVQTDKSQVELQQAQALLGSAIPIADENELRGKLGLEPKTPEELAEIKGRLKSDAAAPSFPGFGFQDLPKDIRQPKPCNNVSFAELYFPEGGFTPPDAGNLPKEAKDILAGAFNSCRTQWSKAHPKDIENQDNKEMCARVAWAAVKKAGFAQNDEGEWIMNTEFGHRTYNADDTELTLDERLAEHSQKLFLEVLEAVEQNEDEVPATTEEIEEGIEDAEKDEEEAKKKADEKAKEILKAARK